MMQIERVRSVDRLVLEIRKMRVLLHMQEIYQLLYPRDSRREKLDKMQSVIAQFEEGYAEIAMSGWTLEIQDMHADEYLKHLDREIAAWNKEWKFAREKALPEIFELTR